MSVKRITLSSGATRWQARWRDPSGEQRSKNFDTKDEATRHERNKRSSVDQGTYADDRGSRITVAQWADDWLASALNLRDGSRQLYRQDLDLYILPALGDRRLARLAAEDIDTFLADQIAHGRAASSVHRYWRTLRRMLNVAVRRRKIQRSPMVDVDPPRVVKEEMLFLLADELERLAAAVDNRTDKKGRLMPSYGYGGMILLAGWGGLRWGECAGLRRRRIDKQRGGVHVAEQWTGTRFEEPKGGGDRFVKIPASVLDALETDGDPAGLVFQAPRGGPVVHSNWRQRVWVPAKKAAGVDPRLRFHDLRHTAVALAIKADAHPEAVKRRLGWSTITLIDTYGHLFPTLDESIADRLDALRADALRGRLRAV